ncbi:MAG: GAF domain-containing protein [Desulfobulbaceae bacterium]|uniref:GAF domain-containing protein n=1 Tax=Candidatus Desulfobia pelagia TaxID=2841692 RepID=A0A8J6NFU1_9BACT|nr:GAF domain-containing protein [Candidatus Desulfobia pelagia]
MDDSHPVTSGVTDAQPPDPVFIQETINSIKDIIASDYGSVSKEIASLFDDVTGLYAGKWPDYQPCQVGYHTLQHALDVSLAMTRIISGYHSHNPDLIPLETFTSGLAAALFHDSGYIKDRDDNSGKGGKFSFSHVARSKVIAEKHLSGLSWAPGQIAYVLSIIDLSDFTDIPDIPTFLNPEEDFVAKSTATADLIAQIADVDYVQRLHLLYDEFQEAYDNEGKEDLIARSIHVYESFQDLSDETAVFYRNFVLPRLQLFDRVDRHLILFFKKGRNPYSENIIANLSGQLKNDRTQWQKLGELLQELGFVSEETIHKALRQQEHPQSSSTEISLLQKSLEHHIIGCHNQRSRSKSLGNILMEMDALKPKTLRQGLLSQILPTELIKELSRNEVNILLETSLLIQNVYNDPWMFSQVLEIINELLDTESCSLLLANPEETELMVAVQSGKILGGSPGEGNTLDKGLSGWVFRHKKAAAITEESIADFFSEYYQQESDQIRSVLAAPLHLNGQVIGVIEAFNKRKSQFGDHDLNLMTLLAHIISNSLSIICQLYRK